jgi:hypothetical protein
MKEYSENIVNIRIKLICVETGDSQMAESRGYFDNNIRISH